MLRRPPRQRRLTDSGNKHFVEGGGNPGKLLTTIEAAASAARLHAGVGVADTFRSVMLTGALKYDAVCAAPAFP